MLIISCGSVCLWANTFMFIHVRARLRVIYVIY